MGVPEATVNENYGPVFRQHEIGLAYKSAAVETEPEPETMQSLADNHLGFCIFWSNPSHHF